MGRRGPAGKRSEQKLGHRTKAELDEVDHVDMTGEVKPPPAPRDWHPLARDWYRSLADSGQRRYMEPSDWQAAKFTAWVMTETLNAKSLSAALVERVWVQMTDLFTTESARRRAKIEINRRAAGEDDGTGAGGDASSGSVVNLADYASVGYGS